MDMNQIVGTHDVALIVLDALRYDVAVEELAAGRTPNLAAAITEWDERHSPGTFTYASHAAFFAGFLPTPARPGRHRRRLALGFDGSETIGDTTCVLEGASIVEGLAARGYHTLCIGGVGFFNLRNPLGTALPSLFAERHWDRSTGVTDPHTFENQLAILERSLALQAGRVFTFMNVAALHQPNHFYLAGGPEQDTVASHAAALRYIDAHIPRLFELLGRRGPTFVIVTSDHGTLYGEDGYVGHRLAHPLVTTVPYAEVML
ncbi:MAG: STM4013/SEN3800 family hydrolase [Kofleriaceae bacterium]